VTITGTNFGSAQGNGTVSSTRWRPCPKGGAELLSLCRFLREPQRGT
jgi:hypothetical protein